METSLSSCAERWVAEITKTTISMVRKKIGMVPRLVCIADVTTAKSKNYYVENLLQCTYFTANVLKKD